MNPVPALRTLCGQAGSALLSLFFPEGNLCGLCGQPMLHEEEVWLCEPCRQELIRAQIPPPEQPFFLDPLLPASLCAYYYDSVAQELVHSLKYRGFRAAAAPLAEGMAGAFALSENLEIHQAELLLPVPLHPRREAQRGYNQAALIAERLSVHLGLPCHSRAMERIRYTRTQVGSTHAQRLRNMIGAFTVSDIPLIYGRNVALVDDVCTTGATAIACAHVLLVCGAKQVSLLSACRA